MISRVRTRECEVLGRVWFFAWRDAMNGNQTTTGSTSSDRAVDFVRCLHDRYVSYHAHKESMAYAGLTLFGAAVGGALVSGTWPPQTWGTYRTAIAFAAVTMLWLGILAYLRFQLQRRRWAALRVAGCERVLAKWIVAVPVGDGLNPKNRPPVRVGRLVRLVNFVWPLKAAVLAIEPASSDNPGTDALEHEHLMVAAGWLLYAVVALYSVREWIPWPDFGAGPTL